MRKDELLSAAYRAPTEAFWEAERMAGGDGYDVMHRAEKHHGWRAIAGWGRDGWDLGSWPLVVIYTHRRDGVYEVAYYVEGDMTVYRYATIEDRNAAIDALAFFHWRAQGESWVDGIESPDDMPPHLCDPYTRARAA